MKLLVKRISYKLLVSMMITIVLSFFVITSCSHASKFSELVNEKGYYYSGTQEGEVIVKGSIFDNLINKLSQIANYLLGLKTLALRGVAVGWMEIAEMILTSILTIDGDTGTINDNAMDTFTQETVNVESIIFNRVPMLDANIFKSYIKEAEKKAEEEEKKEKLEEEIKEILNDNSISILDKAKNIIEVRKKFNEEQKKEQEEEKKKEEAKNDFEKDTDTIVDLIKNAVAKWYYILRLITIILMLILLIFIGIKTAITTIASDKALYKKMLMDWVAGMILVFTIHYIMILIFSVNESIVSAMEPLLKEQPEMQEEYEYGIEKEISSADIETTLYESARTRAYSLKLTDGFTGLVIYGVLVYFAWRFALMYFIRLFNIMILTVIAPVIAVSYAFNKVISGKAKIFSTWLSEYIINVLIQMFHTLIYASFVSTALLLSLKSLPGVILAFVMLNFMLKADKLLRQLFRLSGGNGGLSGTMENMGFEQMRSEMKSMTNAVIGGKLGKEAMKLTYRVATKPVRKLAEATFGYAMVKNANKQLEEERKKIDEENELIRDKNDLEDSINKLQERERQILERQKLTDRYNELEDEKQLLYYDGYTDDSKEVKDILDEQEKIRQRLFDLDNGSLDEIQDSLDSYRDKLEDVNDELDYRKELQRIENLQKKYKADTFGGKVANLFDGTNYAEKGKDGKYHMKKTLREGGVNGAFWRKKKSGIGMTFKNNMKFDKMLGLSSAEKKELKNQVNFWKSSILGVASAIVGFPALVVNPMLGMGLLAQAGSARINVKIRRKRLKCRPAYKNQKNYKFCAFSYGAQSTIRVEAARQVKAAQSKMTKRIAAKHPKFAKALIGTTNFIVKPITLAGVTIAGLGTGMFMGSGVNGAVATALGSKRFSRKIVDIDIFEQERLVELGYKKYRKKFKDANKQLNELETNMLVREYEDMFKSQEQAEKNNAERKNERQLMFSDKLQDDNVVEVQGNVFEIGSNDSFEKDEKTFVKEVEKIDENDSISREEKISLIKGKISERKVDLLKNQIIKYYSTRGVIDIKNTSISVNDITKIKANILGVLEERGIIKRGEISLDDELISTDDILSVHKDLTAKSDETNEALEQKMASSACFEYMKKYNIIDLNELKSEYAKNGIYDIIKEKLMSEDSKKSAYVIQQISGQNKKKDDIKLSDNMKLMVENDTEQIKEVVKIHVTKPKEKLVERETNRRMNQTKKQLEEAICADTTQNIEDEAVLDMLFVLSEIGNKNVHAEILGVKGKKVEENEKNILNYYQSDEVQETLYYQNKFNNFENEANPIMNFSSTNSNSNGTFNANSNTSQKGKNRKRRKLRNNYSQTQHINNNYENRFFMNKSNENYKKTMETRIYGSSRNVIKLINNVGIKNKDY